MIQANIGDEYQNVTYKIDLEVNFDWLNKNGATIGNNRSHQVIDVSSLEDIDTYVVSLDKSQVYVDDSIEETSKGYVKLVYDETNGLYRAYLNNIYNDQILEGSYLSLSNQEIKIFVSVIDQDGKIVGYTSVKTLNEIK